MKKISDEQLEEWLREMPKLNDHRDPHDIYENISKKLEQRPRKTWIIPSFATAAAVFLVAILFFNVVDGGISSNHSADKSTQEEAATEQNASLKKEESTVDNKARMDVGNIENANETNDITFQATEEPITAIYAEDVGAMEVFTLAIPESQGQNVIPVSFLVEPVDPSEKLGKLEEVMASIDEKEWGLNEYYPLQADLEIDQASNSLKVDVASDHPYQYGSTSQEIFEKVIQQLLHSMDLDQAVFTTDDTEMGINLGNDVVNSITKAEPLNRTFYLFYSNELPFLVPYTVSYTTIEEAFEAMKTNVETHNLRAPLLVDQIQTVTIDETNTMVTITLNKGINIEDTLETIRSIEAILLTVKSFGYEKVKFNNTPIDYVGRFFLKEEIQVPIAANKKSIE
ncbi:hypothetical protein [Robertmurraya korlensis]|uniref:hypothetical protein n=1 Tax=Robertmurraya korlensis TaxID=519977 RepID=UPI00082657F0|nr:hypothetical protein [Robertmurraya korlensis]